MIFEQPAREQYCGHHGYGISIYQYRTQIWITSHKNMISDYTADFAAKLYYFVLTLNHFKFGDGLFLQINGTTMGTRMGPQYAHNFLNSHPLRGPWTDLCNTFKKRIAGMECLLEL